MLPVESLLAQLLLDRVDSLLLVREPVRQRVDRLPLGRAGVGVDGDEQRRGRRDEVSATRGALIRRAAAARESERDEGEQNAELAD